LLSLFSYHQVNGIHDFLEGRLPDIAAEAAAVNDAVRLLKDEKLRADFDVYLKNSLAVWISSCRIVRAKFIVFLQSVWDISSE
jgi:hypothetical protein